MATTFKTVRTNHTADGDSDIYRVPRGGALLIEAFWIAGTGTITVYSRSNIDGTFVPTLDASGNALTVNIATGTRYWREELLAHVATEYKITITSASSLEVDTILGRVIAE